jgi:hypothetical protein
MVGASGVQDHSVDTVASSLWRTEIPVKIHEFLSLEGMVDRRRIGRHVGRKFECGSSLWKELVVIRSGYSEGWGSWQDSIDGWLAAVFELGEDIIYGKCYLWWGGGLFYPFVLTLLALFHLFFYMFDQVIHKVNLFDLLGGWCGR